MAVDEGFRFCLHFKPDSEENIAVGNFLKALGHKKSKIIIQAITEYRNNHPEVNMPGSVTVQVNRNINRDEIAKIIAEEVTKQLKNKNIVVSSNNSENSAVDINETVSESVSELLMNLDMFN